MAAWKQHVTCLGRSPRSEDSWQVTANARGKATLIRYSYRHSQQSNTMSLVALKPPMARTHSFAVVYLVCAFNAE
jgi:hypothetical protein